MNRERGHHIEITPETQKLLKSPELAFDSDLEAANTEYEQLMKRLVERGEISRSGDNAIFKTVETQQGAPPIIQIIWPEREGHHMVLHLTPHTVGKGPEAGVIAYSGEYGVACQKGEKWKYNLVPLSKLYCIPVGLDIIIKPTATRWAIGIDETSKIFGDNTRTLYMGLGFLLLGQEWMHIGMHEAGHLPYIPDENLAWNTANRHYASLHKPQKEVIKAGKSSGLFKLLRKPQPYGNEPTIGQIVKFGLVSHSVAGEDVRIPKSWRQKSDEIMHDFTRVIERATQAYYYFIGI